MLAFPPSHTPPPWNYYTKAQQSLLSWVLLLRRTQTKKWHPLYLTEPHNIGGGAVEWALKIDLSLIPAWPHYLGGETSLSQLTLLLQALTFFLWGLKEKCRNKEFQKSNWEQLKLCQPKHTCEQINSYNGAMKWSIKQPNLWKIWAWTHNEST